MSLRGRISLPSFDWARVVRALPGLVGVLEPDGRIVAVSGRLFEEDPDTLELTHAWLLAAGPHQERIRLALERAVYEGGTHRAIVRSRRVDRLFAVEIGPAENGLYGMIWAGCDMEPSDEEDTDEFETEVIESPLAAIERQAAPPRRLHAESPLPASLSGRLYAESPPVSPSRRTLSESPSTATSRAQYAPPVPQAVTPKPAGPEYVIVAPLGLRRLASRVQRTLDLVTPRTAVWFDDEFDGKANRLTNTSKVLFVGPSKYADFLRKVIEPRFDQAGAAWATTERKAIFWIHDEGEERDVRRRMETALSRVAKVSLSRAVSLPGDDPPSGKELAGKLLLEPTPTRPSLDEERYLLALAMFLLDGFETFHRSAPR